MPPYTEVTRQLREHYDREALTRADAERVSPWKVEERSRFLALLNSEGRGSLLDIGAGTGIHGKFFQDEGLDVVCTDLSSMHVELCKAKGLVAYEMDFLSLDFGGRTFASVFAMNCLLHVPSLDLPRVLELVHDVLEPGGLFYLGQYGGYDQEGVIGNGSEGRFWSFFADERLQAFGRTLYEQVDFRRIERNFSYDQHFQALILRRPAK